MAHDTSKVQQKLMLALESTILQNVTSLETSLGYYDAAIPGKSHSTEIYDAMGKIKSIVESLSLKATKAVNSNGRIGSSSVMSIAATSARAPTSQPKVSRKNTMQRTLKWERLYAKEPTAKATVQRNIGNLNKLAIKSMMCSSFEAMKISTTDLGVSGVNQASVTSFPTWDKETEGEISLASNRGSAASTAKADVTETVVEKEAPPLAIVAPKQDKAEGGGGLFKVEKTITKTSGDTGDLDAKLAAIDMKRKELEKKASAKRSHRATDRILGPDSDKWRPRAGVAADVSDAPLFGSTVPSSGTEMLSPVQTLPLGAETTLLHQDLEDDIPMWGSSQKNPGDDNLSPRGYNYNDHDSGHTHSLSRTSSTMDGDRESAAESPIPALFMAGAGGEALEFDASVDPSRLWITGQDLQKQPVASPSPLGGSTDKKKNSAKSARRPAPLPPKKLDSSSYYHSPTNTQSSQKHASRGASGRSSSTKKTNFSNHTGSGYEAI